MDFRIDGQVALVTGASKGLGRAAAIALAEQGADLVLNARDEAALAEVAAAVRAQGRRAAVIVADLAGSAAAAGEMVARAHGAFGRLDVVLNNAGTSKAAPVLEVTEADYDRVMDINLKSAFFVAQACGRIFVGQGRGKVINMGSMLGSVALHERSVYSMTKGGMVQMTRSMALEWAPHNVQVNLVGPTYVETPMTRKYLSDPTFKEKVMSRLPAGRMATTDEVSGAVCYFASPLSDMTTGQILLIDGGWTAQ